MKSLEEIKQLIESHVPGAQITVEGQSLLISKEHWFAAANLLKNNEELSFDYLSSVTGVDYKDYLESVYHLFSISKLYGPLTIKVRTDRNEAKTPSVTSIWRSAEFQEREAYDLFGIHYEGHPDLRRILMWEGFEHHPMRKDYVADDQDRGPENF
jgi:NADH-quinone oxidoreductase subunit C